MEKHIAENHELFDDSKRLDNFNEYDQQGRWRYVVKVDGQLFLVCFMKRQIEFQIGVYALSQHVGCVYDYNITFWRKDEKKKVGASGTCQYFPTYYNEALDKDNCVKFPTKLIDQLHDNGTLSFTLLILKN